MVEQRWFWCVLLLKVSGLAGAAAAWAQPVAPSATVSAGPAPVSSTVDEVLVTARRRIEDVRSVPIAVDVVTGSQLTQARVADLGDLQRQVGSLQTSQIDRDDAFVVLRGQGPGVGAFPGVVTYFNEVPFRGLGQGDYYDLSGIQVLKGPQGTLFGRNSNGGAILFSSARPTKDFGGYAQATAGNYDDGEVQGAINLPLVGDTLLLRVAGAGATRAGFTRLEGSERRLDGRNYQSGRISLRWTPTARLSNDIVADGTWLRTDGTSAILIGLNPSGPLSLFPAQLRQTIFALLAEQQQLGPRVQVGASTNPARKVESWGVMDRFEADLGGSLVFTNIVADRRYQRLLRSDYDGTPLPLIDAATTPTGWDTDETQVSEEAQIKGRSAAVEYTAGAYLQHNQSANQQRQFGEFFFQPIEQIARPDDLSQALYGEVTYQADALLRGLSFSGGYRHTWDRRRQTAATINAATGACTGSGATPPNCLLEDAVRFNAGNWSLDAAWQVTASTLLYATARRGYKSGGLNLGQPYDSLRVYQPEFLTDQEIGLKSGFSTHSIDVRFDMDAYHGHYSDVQVNAVVVSNNALYNLVDNGADATIQGLEASISASFRRVLDFEVSYAYTDAHYNHYISSIYGDLSGAPWPYTSKSKGSVGATYHAPAPGWLASPELSVHYSFQSASTFGYDPDPATHEPGYGLIDARLDFRRLGGRPVDLGLFVTNSTDKLYRTGVIGIYNSAGIDSAVYGEPRMFGAQLRVHFGASGA